MSNKLVSMQHVRTIIQQLQKGFSQRRIARELKLSRNTVKQYAERLQASALSFDALQGLDDASLSALVYAASKQLQPDARRDDFTARQPYFLAELGRRGVTRLLLWQEYKQHYPEGYEYSKFCELLSQADVLSGASMHFEHKAAEVVMVDFAGDPMHYVDKESAELIACPVLVCVLPYSGYSYAVALPNATLPFVVKALNQCLAYFGGVPHSIKSDNMKQIVTRSCRYEPLFTEMIQQWALHNNIALLAARPRKPKDKASVENEVKLTYQRIYAPLRDRIFYSLSELNGAIVQQLSLHHGQLLQRKSYSRLQRFTGEEQPLLQPLPPTTYQMKHRVTAKVQKNYHITLGEDWHHYSVPFHYIGKQVNAVYDTDTVEIYLDHRRVALHSRSYKKHGYTTSAEHMPEGHRHYFEQRGWDADYFLKQALIVGPSTHAYVQGVLKTKQFTEQTYNGCVGILRLAKAYSAERLEAACKRALKAGSYTYRTLHNILQHNLDKVEPAQAPTLFTMPRHDNVRGPQAYN